MKTYTDTEYDIEDYDYIRDNMTDEEVISILERIDSGWIPDWNYTKTEDDYKNYKLHLALWKAIDAVKTKIRE